MLSLNFNYSLFLFGVVVYLFFDSVLGIILGLSGTKKSQTYTLADSLVYGGLFVFLILCCIF